MGRSWSLVVALMHGTTGPLTGRVDLAYLSFRTGTRVLEDAGPWDTNWLGDIGRWSVRSGWR